MPDLQNHIRIILDRANAMTTRGERLKKLVDETEQQIADNLLTQTQQDEIETLVDAIVLSDDHCATHYAAMDESAGDIEAILGI